MADKKTININETEQAILDCLANASEPLTLAEISENIGKKLVSGNINALITNKGKVAKGEDKEIIVTSKRKVATYRLA